MSVWLWLLVVPSALVVLVVIGKAQALRARGDE